MTGWLQARNQSVTLSTHCDPGRQGGVDIPTSGIAIARGTGATVYAKEPG